MVNRIRLWEYKGRLIVVGTEDIYYFRTEQRKVYVHTKHSVYEIGGSIKREEEAVQGLPFIRTHNAFLVNLRYLECIGRQDAVLRNGEKIPVSERRGNIAKNHLKRYWEHRKNAKNRRNFTRNQGFCPTCLHKKLKRDMLLL